MNECNSDEGDQIYLLFYVHYLLTILTTPHLFLYSEIHGLVNLSMSHFPPTYNTCYNLFLSPQGLRCVCAYKRWLYKCRKRGRLGNIHLLSPDSCVRCQSVYFMWIISKNPDINTLSQRFFIPSLQRPRLREADFPWPHKRHLLGGTVLLCKWLSLSLLKVA